MNNGFILLSRTLLDSDVFASQKLLKIWIWCLLKANFQDRFVPLKIGKGETVITIKRGSFLFGRFKAEDELFIDGSTIYKSIKKLEEREMIKIESNNQYSIITICKYDDYQHNFKRKVTSKEQLSNKQVTSKGQASNTTNNVNKDNKEYMYKKKTSTEIKVEYFLNLFNSVKSDLKKIKAKHRTLTKIDTNNLLKLIKVGYTSEDFVRGMYAMDESEWVRENDMFTPAHFLRNENFEKYVNTKLRKHIAIKPHFNENLEV